MNNAIIELYMKDLQATPEAEKINNLWEKGLLCYAEAVEMLKKAEENNRFYYVIQYKGYINKKFYDYCDILYTYSEAMEELNRLKEAAPDFKWRTRKEPRTEESVILYTKCRQRTTNRP